MDYRAEHLIGRRTGARKAFCPLVSRKQHGASKAEVSYHSPSLAPTLSLENSRCATSSETYNNLTKLVSREILQQLHELKDSSVCSVVSSFPTEEFPVITFKRDKLNSDPDISFKIEHDSSSEESKQSTRPSSSKSEYFEPILTDSSPTPTPRQVEHLDDDITFTEVKDGRECTAFVFKNKDTRCDLSIERSKKNSRRAASLDARVRTMLLLEKHKLQAHSNAPSSKTSTCLPASEKELDKKLKQNSEWYDSCFASSPKAVKVITKEKEKSLKEVQDIERRKRKKNKQCRNCMRMLKLLLVKTSQDILEKMDCSKSDISRYQKKSGSKVENCNFCTTCRRELSEIAGNESGGQYQVRLTKLSNEDLKHQHESQSKKRKLDVLPGGSSAGNEQQKSPCLVTSPRSVGWQFDGYPHNKRIYCRHPDGVYRPAVRSCYPSVVNEDVILSPGNHVLIAAQSHSQPFVAMVTDLYICPISGSKMAHIFWFYGQEILSGSRKLHERELMASKHADDIDLNCIDDKCFVLTRHQYCRYSVDQVLRSKNRWMKKLVRRPFKLNGRDSLPTKHEHLRTPPNYIPSTSALIPIRENPSLQKLNETDPELIFWCNKVFDLQRKQILKNPH